jgi:putative oxidoreductase
MLLFNHQQEIGFLALRVALGIIFIYHGVPKVRESAETAKAMNASPGLVALLGSCEILGGIAVIAGFLTQVAAIGLGLLMLGAIGMKIAAWHVRFWAMDKTGWEFDFILLAAAACLALIGAGAWSIDALIGWWP